jgi:flagellar basal-body rod protein FlgB
MIDSILSDSTLRIAQRALDGLSVRRDVIGQNVANVDTPGYRAQQVSFENVLSDATRSNSGTLKMAVTNTAHKAKSTNSSSDLVKVSPRNGGSVRADGNNVDIDQELTELTETGIRYETISTSVSNKFSLMKALAESR